MIWTKHLPPQAVVILKNAVCDAIPDLIRDHMAGIDEYGEGCYEIEHKINGFPETEEISADHFGGEDVCLHDALGRWGPPDVAVTESGVERVLIIF
jgi:hypothetical protein